MRKYYILILLLFIVSCTTTTEEAIPTYCPPGCSGGSESVEIIVNSPSDIVFANDRMPVSVDLLDIGESSVEFGELCITGLNVEDFSELSGCNCQSYYITLDDSDDQNFESALIDFGTSFISPEASGEHFLTFINRYSYTTYAPFEICFTNDLGDDCISGDKLESSSSGPLKVTSIQERIVPDGNAVDVRLSIEAEYTGDSMLISQEDINSDSCLTIPNYPITADVSIIMFGVSHECGVLNFFEDEDSATITCKLDDQMLSNFIGEQDTYEGWVRIDYAVEQIDSVKFKVQE